jgi:hypothetical protein
MKEGIEGRHLSCVGNFGVGVMERAKIKMKTDRKKTRTCMSNKTLKNPTTFEL